MAAQHPTCVSRRVQVRYLAPVGPCFQGLAERRVVVLRVERRTVKKRLRVRIPAKAWACGLAMAATIAGGLIG